VADGDKADRRRATCLAAGTAIGALGDDQLQAAVDAWPSTGRSGWGISQAMDIAGFAVFVKRIPLTDVEHRHMASTRNTFRLPDYYHYGVGSAGFGVSRELATHRRTTEWVMNGEIESFPLLYHARVMPRVEQAPDPRFKLDEYVARWNGSKAVANYITARARARHEVWLILEHFPHTLATWLPDNQGATARVLDQLCRTAVFLRSKGVVHFDAHLRNVVGDGEDAFLTDFGLALDAAFDMTDRERAFLDRHRRYDEGEVIASVGVLLLDRLWAMAPEDRARIESKCAIAPDDGTHARLSALLAHVEDLHAGGDLALEPAFVETVTTYRAVILFMSSFLSELRDNRRKNTRFDDDALGRLLAAAHAGG
jgi:hypothetical protein